MAVLNSRYFAWILLAMPAVFMIHGHVTGQLYYGEIMHASGELSARLLIVTMAITPLRLMLPGAKWPVWLMQRRRYLGLATFGYALLHTVHYLENATALSEVIEESLAFEYWTGWLALLLFIPLAATSNDRIVRMLRGTWKKLHRWVYAAAVLSFLHWIFVAFDVIPGLMHASTLVVLETIRIRKSRINARA
jgi:sulfoxide reductase heme-binding subunit YedZ